MKLKKFWTNVNLNVWNSITLFSNWNMNFDAAESAEMTKKNLFLHSYIQSTDLQKINVKYKLLYQLCSELYICLSRGGGYATIEIQLRKVNKGSQERRILEKMIICFKKMYHLDYIVICKKKIPICFKKFQMFQGLCLLQYTEGS